MNEERIEVSNPRLSVVFDGNTIELFRLGVSQTRISIASVASVTTREQKKGRGPILRVGVWRFGREVGGFGASFDGEQRSEVEALVAAIDAARREDQGTR